MLLIYIKMHCHMNIPNTNKIEYILFNNLNKIYNNLNKIYINGDIKYS